jgi:hypothetical protein
MKPSSTSDQEPLLKPIWDGVASITFGLFRLKGVFKPPSIPTAMSPATGILSSLPQRSGTRPVVSGLVPQRQMDQRAEAETFETLSTLLRELADENPSRFRVGTSFLERHAIVLSTRPEAPDCQIWSAELQLIKATDL